MGAVSGQREVPSRLKRVLLADDSLLVAESVQEVLSDAGYEVFVVSRCAAVLPAVVELCPDLLLLDVTLPDGSGDALAIQVKKRMGVLAPSILLFSAMPEQELEALGRQCGAAGVIPKRGDNHLLLRMVRTELGDF